MTLLRHLIRAVPWAPWLIVLILATGLAWMTSDVDPNFGSRHMYLRTGLLVAALGFCFAFDDRAAPVTDAAPSPLRRRRVLRILAAVVPWLGVVVLLLGAGTTQGLRPALVLPANPILPLLPAGRFLLEGATLAAWGLAVASIVATRGDEEPGRIASVVLLVVYIGSWLLPENSLLPWTGPAEARWQTVLPYWWLALTIGLLVTVVASWDTRQGSLGRVLRSPLATARSTTAPNPN